MMLNSVIITCAGRDFSNDDIAHIVRVTKLYPNLSRRELIQTLCEHLQWQTPTGTNKRQSCERLLEILESRSLVKLPTKCMSKVRQIKHTAPRLSERTNPHKPIEMPLKALSAIELDLIDAKADKLLWNEYIARYHYLGYKYQMGRTLRYWIKSQEHLLGCLMISHAARGLRARDSWIGWTAKQRLSNLPWVINNSRFLLFPWVKVPYLASHVLGKLCRCVAQDYERAWGFRPVLLETFVDGRKYTGACYKASNFRYLGLTQGSGFHYADSNYTTSPKMIFVYPLVKDACQRLVTGTSLISSKHEAGEYYE